MLAKLLALLGNQRFMKYGSISLLIALIVFMAVMDYRQHQAMLASYCKHVQTGQDSDWRIRLGYMCREVTP